MSDSESGPDFEGFLAEEIHEHSLKYTESDIDLDNDSDDKLFTRNLIGKIPRMP